MSDIKAQRQIVNLLVLRLMDLLDKAPYSMDAVVKFKNGTNHGTIRWVTTQANRQIHECRRWINTTFQAVISEFTAEVMREVYGDDAVLCDEEHRDDPVVIALEWNDFPYVYYMGFSTTKQLDSWIDKHKGWLTWDVVRQTS